MDTGSVLAGKFRLVSLLGRGGMGSVWSAVHLDLQAPVAVKLINLGGADRSESLARFHREAQAAANLRSPHVVQILDHGVDETSGAPFIAMELMEGESLSQRLARRQKVTASETAKYVTHIARALMRAHEQGIVHRDLKPDNVFLVHNEDDEIAKVLDFGIAKWTALSGALEAGTRTGTVMGTPYYMSPEQISGAKGIDHRTDLWALGVIACECLTGQKPFQGNNVVELGLLICSGTRQPASKLGAVPEGFDDWFARATARDKNERFQSARQLAEELRRLCAKGGGESVWEAAAAPAGTPSAEPPSTGGSILDKSILDKARPGLFVPSAAFQAPQTELELGSVGPVSRTGTGAEQSAQRTRRRSLWLGASALLLVAGSIGAWSWRRTSGPASSPGGPSAAQTSLPSAPIEPPQEPAIPSPTEPVPNVHPEVEARVTEPAVLDEAPFQASKRSVAPTISVAREHPIQSPPAAPTSTHPALPAPKQTPPPAAAAVTGHATRLEGSVFDSRK
jgi:eukaryotic-like serine/threonine-protein kinase